MPIPWGSVISAGAGVLGGLLGGKGQAKANESNERIARENRAFQERMSNTAYWRASRDLENSGLNRILALGSPASTPGGATATMGNEGAAAIEGAERGANTAMGIRRLRQEVKNMKATEQDVRTAAAKKVVDMLGVNQSMMESRKRIELIDQQKKALGVPATIGEAATSAKGILKKGVRVGGEGGFTDKASMMIGDIVDFVKDPKIGGKIPWAKGSKFKQKKEYRGRDPGIIKWERENKRPWPYGEKR